MFIVFFKGFLLLAVLPFPGTGVTYMGSADDDAENKFPVYLRQLYTRVKEH